MTKTFIHIGFPKTATTTLQSALMKYPRCAYLGKGLRDTMEPSLSLDIARAVLFSDQRRFAERLPELRENLSAIAKKSECLVLSDEAFSFAEHMNMGDKWHCVAMTDHEVIAQRLSELCPGAGVLVSIRNQYSFLQSFFRQQNRGHGSNSVFEAYIARALDDLSHRSILHLLRYDEVIEVYRSRFGSDRVMVSAYEDTRGDFGQYLVAVAQFCGLDARELEKAWGGEHSNVTRYSKDRPAVARARQMIPSSLKRLIPKEQRMRINKSMEVPMLTTDFSVEQKEALAVYFAESNARVSQQTGLDLARWGYPLR